MMNLTVKKAVCTIMSAALVLTASGVSHADAAKKAKPSPKKLNLTIGEKKTIKIKNKKSGAAYLFKSSAKKKASVNKKGVVTAKKAGKAVIKITEKYKNKTTKIGNVNVTIKKNTKNDTSSTAVPNQTPDITPVSDTHTTDKPENTAAPTKEPIVYPDSHDTPDGFDVKADGIEYGEVEKITYYSSVTGKDRKANIILPANYSADNKYPVLYLLHGIGGNENEWLDGNPAAIVGNLAAKGEAKDMIIVIPNIRAGADDSYPSDNAFSLEHYAKFDNFINDLRECLMPYIEENYSIAVGRENTAIGGLSMGGRESLYIGLNMLDTFGYIAAFSPGYGVFEYDANGVHENGLFTEETFTIPEEYRNNTFLMIVNGIDEGGENALGGTCSRVLTKNGVNHWFYTTPGAHDFTTWKNGLYNFARCIFMGY